MEPLDLEDEMQVNDGVNFINPKYIQYIESGIENYWFLFPIFNFRGGCLNIMFGIMEVKIDEGTVILVTSIVTVREVVTDQLGVKTGPVIAAEVSGLLHVQVEVESAGLLAWI